MPQLGVMNKVVIYADPKGDNIKIGGDDLPNNYYTWPSSDAENEKVSLVTRNNSWNSLSEHSLKFGQNTIDLEWRDVTYNVNGKNILKGLSGSSKSGELTAIMGPSGSGKTSLVNILSGFVQKGVCGEVLVNGAKRDIATFRRLTCYILQDDHILPQFTVRELVTFASRLKIPSTYSEKDRQKAVDDCIYCLGLVAQQNQKANTLSGGQRKRLCIAQEIVNNPPLIFLDEPASGLDSSSCLQCIQLLKTLSARDRNIICTIHQPSSRIYEIFDNLYMLSDGDCIYRGPTNDLLTYLENQGLQCPKYHSPTDFLTDIAIGLYGEWNYKLKKIIKDADSQHENWYTMEMRELYESKGRNIAARILCSFPNKVKEITQESWRDIATNRYSTSNLNQFKVLLTRSFLYFLRDPINLYLRIMGSVVIGLLLGCIYYDTGNDATKVFNTAGLIFTLLLFIVITSQIPTVLTFPLQRMVFVREHHNCWYSTKIYLLATSLSQTPFLIVCPVISCSLLYWLTGQPPEWDRFFIFLFTGIFTSMNAESIGLMIGAAFNVQNGVMLSLMIASAATVLTGFFIPRNECPLPIRWLISIAYTRYHLKAMLGDIYIDRPALNCTRRFCFYKDPMKLIESLDLSGDIFTNTYIALIFFVVFKITAFLIFEYKTSKLR